MKNTKFQVQEVFGDINVQDTISPETINKLNNFFIKDDVNISIHKTNVNVKTKFSVRETNI